MTKNNGRDRRNQRRQEAVARTQGNLKRYAKGKFPKHEPSSDDLVPIEEKIKKAEVTIANTQKHLVGVNTGREDDGEEEAQDG